MVQSKSNELGHRIPSMPSRIFLPTKQVLIPSNIALSLLYYGGSNGSEVRTHSPSPEKFLAEKKYILKKSPRRKVTNQSSWPPPNFFCIVISIAYKLTHPNCPGCVDRDAQALPPRRCRSCALFHIC